GEVDEQVDDREHDGHEQHAALDDGVIARRDRVVHPAADAGPAEHGLGEQGAGQQRAEAEADDRYDRQQGVAQRVYSYDPALLEALGPGGPDIVLAQDVQHRGAGHAHDDGQWDRPERDRRHDQVPGGVGGH